MARVAPMPKLPAPDAEGNFPAVGYARASLARKIVRERVRAGLTQRELAHQSGVRVETVCRIEEGEHTPSISTIVKIDRARTRAGAGRAVKRGRKAAG